MVDSTIHAQIVNEPMESGSRHASMRMKTSFFFAVDVVDAVRVNCFSFFIFSWKRLHFSRFVLPLYFFTGRDCQTRLPIHVPL